MTLFLIFLIIFFLLSNNISRNIYCNDLFWLIISWSLIIGTNFFSGVSWSYDVSYEVYIFIAICFISYYLGRKYGLKKAPKEVLLKKISKHNINLLILCGYLGVIAFVADYIRLNGFLNNEKSNYNISLIGSVGNLFIPILLVQGLYLTATGLIESNKVSIKGLLLLLSYAIPCMLNSGRESILYIVIGFFCIYSYANPKSGLNLRAIHPRKILVSLLSILVILLFLGIILSISTDRFGVNQINSFIAKTYVPSRTLQEAEKWGKFQFLYYNTLSYFGHQIPFLNFLIKEYKGPYLFGMYELNIISRRLPEFLGLDYRLAGQELRFLFRYTGASFSGCWHTVLGAFIIDFSKYFTPLICFLSGFFVGKVRAIFVLSQDIRYLVVVSIICIAMFTTIQLGPFFNILMLGSFIWWYILFGRDEISDPRKIIIFRDK